MKKAVICLISMLLLCGCKANRTSTVNDKAVTFINGINEADLWILPETEENLKTTVWGKATFSGIKANETQTVSLCEAGENGLYIIRMIDTGNTFYSADGITLEPGWTIKLKGNDLNSLEFEVTDENGALLSTYRVFAASL